MAEASPPRSPGPSSSRGTSTSNFGVGKRESHDASDFYSRFTPPEISSEEAVSPISVANKIWLGDARHMDDYGDVADNSVALVVTSPPYFAGKAYEEALGEGHIPATYAEYCEMLYEVFRECKRKLQPGGRIAVNVANLGRKPYRSLAADVISILQDDLKMLLRGEIIWRKSEGAGGSCAWGSFRSPSNPVLRDTTERVIVASKGRFDRAGSRGKSPERRTENVTITVDEFLESTLDVWEIPPESATRVGHPAPFPVALPLRLINFYTYRGELVLDPFMGAGSTAVAAVRTNRAFVGFDTEAEYVDLAEKRVEEAKAEPLTSRRGFVHVESPARPSEDASEEDFQARSTRSGKKAREIARELLELCGFTEIEEGRKLRGLGVEVNFVARSPAGDEWFFDVSGAFSSTRPGLRRTDTLWKTLGRAYVIRQSHKGVPLVFLTTDRPDPRSAGGRALEEVLQNDRRLMVVEMFDEPDKDRLRAAASLGFDEA